MWLYLPSNCAPVSACSEKASTPDFSMWESIAEPFATWSGKPLLPPSLSRLWKREPLLRRLSGLTCSPSTADDSAAQWIASLLDSRAKTSVSPVAGPGSTASVLASSSESSTLPTIAVRGSSFWRTSQASLLPPPPLWTKPKAISKNERPPASWENWPTAGGMRNGSLFQRPTLERTTSGTGGSASLGAWPTPDCNTSTYSNGHMGQNIREATSLWLTPNVPNGGRSVSEALVQSKGMTPEGEKKTVGLESQTRYWATPKTITGGANSQRELRGAGGPDLQEQVQAWARPTPRATDGTNGGPNQAGSKGDLMLPSATAQWPTPASRDYKGANSADHALVTGGGRKHMDQLANFVEHSPYSPLAQETPVGQESSQTAQTSPRRLNPAFDCWLMGWPVWWTNPGITNSVRSEMELYRSRLHSQLSFLLGEQGS